MKIELVFMEIRNFKGIQSLDIEFSHRMQIYGRNGRCKSSILDAYQWCLFGKNSSGASVFSVSPLNEDGTKKPYHDVDVMCRMLVDGVTKEFRRRWVEKRSKRDNTLKGYEGVYYLNDAPVKEAEYSQAIAEICNREELFKLISATGTFNRMKDDAKRRVLAGMANVASDIELAAEFPNLLKALQDGKTVEQYKADVKDKKNRAEVQKSQYPIRLKENADSRPVVPDNIDEIRLQAEQLDKEIKGYERRLTTGRRDDTAIHELKKQIAECDEDIAEIKKSSARQLKDKRDRLQNDADVKRERMKKVTVEIETAKLVLNKYNQKLSQHTESLESIKKDWKEVNESVVDTTVDTVCPTCGKPFSQFDIDTRKNEIIRAFNADKLKRLGEINNRGKSEQEFINGIRDSIKDKEDEKKKFEDELAELGKDIMSIERSIAELPTLDLLLSASMEYQKLSDKVGCLRARLNGLTQPTDNELSVVEKKKEVEVKLAGLNAELSKLDEIKRLDERKEELLEKQKDIAQVVANYERLEDEIRDFSMKKIDLIEQSISSKFRLVKFKMFEYNLSNDGVRDVCICMVNGVPYQDLNTAMQYNADIDIINALSAHYGIIAPVFIDRAESINDIEDTESQRIDLYVTKTDYELRIEHTL